MCYILYTHITIKLTCILPTPSGGGNTIGIDLIIKQEDEYSTEQGEYEI